MGNPAGVDGSCGWAARWLADGMDGDCLAWHGRWRFARV